MGSRRKEDMEVLHARIRRSAVRLFAERGYGATSIQAIANDVGISKHALLHHYSSKEALRTAALELVSRHWHDLLPRLVIAATSGGDRLDTLLAEIILFLKEEPEYCRFLMRELLDRPTQFADELSESFDPWMRLAVDLIERGQKEGTVNPDLDAIAFIWQAGVTLLGGLSLLGLNSRLSAHIEPEAWQNRQVKELMGSIQARLLPPSTEKTDV